LNQRGNSLLVRKNFGLVSWVSPLAKALHGAKVGDLVSWKRPAGDQELEVLKLSYATE